MISPLSVTDRYILQPTLIARHKKTLEWLSAALLWNREVAFFQKLLDQFAGKFSSDEDKKKIDHFQSIITYYSKELLSYATAKLRIHEKRLAEMLQHRDEVNTQYFIEHDGLMGEMESLNNQIADYKFELFKFIEKVM
jgi:hypothetical protein